MRNEFTDALNEEIAARKILNRAKVQSAEDKIFLSETEEISEPETPAKKISANNNISPVEKISAEKNIPPVEEFSAEEKSESKKIVITKADFERRVLAEADNDFYEEENIRSKFTERKNPPVFHSKSFENTPSEPEENISEEINKDLYRKLSRAEIAGVTLSSIMLIYSFTTLDKPLFFLALSLLSHLLRPFIGGLCGKHNRAVQNALRSFSFVTFFGAILLIFL